MQEEEKKRDAYRELIDYEQEQESAKEPDWEESGDWDNTEEDGDFDNFCVDTGGIFEEEEEEALFASLNESLMRQVAEELDGTQDGEQGAGEETTGGKKMGKTKKVLTVVGSLVLVLVLATVFLV